MTDLKAEIDSNTIIVGEFNIPLTIMDTTSRQKSNKEKSYFNNTINQMDITETYRTFYLTAEEYTFFSSTHRTFFWIDPMIDHKPSLDKFMKIKIIPSIFSNHSEMKLEINDSKKMGKFINMWKISNTLLSSH